MANSSRKTLALLVVVFVLPVILAWFALNNDWFNKAATNRGELINPPHDARIMLEGEEPIWRILYVMPSQCEQACENALYSLEQVWIALGKESDRAQSTVMVTESSDVVTVNKLKNAEHIHLLTTNQQNVKQVFKDAPTDAIFLVDTLNNVMLRYPLQIEQQQAVMHSRDILADLKKLLKLSRIG